MKKMILQGTKEANSGVTLYFGKAWQKSIRRKKNEVNVSNCIFIITKRNKIGGYFWLLILLSEEAFGFDEKMCSVDCLFAILRVCFFPFYDLNLIGLRRKGVVKK